MSSAFVTTLFSLCLLAPIGCAVSSEPVDGTADDVAEAKGELTSVDRSLAGKYYDHSIPTGGIARLSLEADGTYAAHFEAGGEAFCITAPCLLPESGTWTATRTTRGTRLRLRSSSHSDSRSRVFDVKRVNDRLEVSAAGREPQSLDALEAGQCLDDSDCSAATESCAPRLCLMFCAAGDPFCCGPSTCAPKTRP